MYSKRAISISRRVCQFLRQTSSAFSHLKKLSTAELSHQFGGALTRDNSSI